jgi:hypothetical protein
MKHLLMAGLLLGAAVLSLDSAYAARRVVVRKGGRVTRVHVTVRPGFPIRRALPNVVVRSTTVRVVPRVYLAPVAFAAVAVAASPAVERVWSDAATLDREEGWTDVTMNVDRRGAGLLLEIDRGTAQVSFAEVVFDNGDAQVIDFNDRVHATGVYSLIDFKDGRKVDHVRVVAKADSRESVIRLHLLRS